MAAKIRLKKVGRKGQPSYRVVVLDGRKPRDAKVVADIGRYDPKTDPATFQIDNDAALKWLLTGAKPTKMARDLLSRAGVMVAWDAAKRAGVTAEPEAAPATASEAQPAAAPEAEAKAEPKAKAPKAPKAPKREPEEG